MARLFQYKLLFTGHQLNPLIVHWVKLYYAPVGITLEPVTPLPGTVSACSHQRIKIDINSYAGIDSSSVRLLVSNEEYTLNAPELHLQDDSLLIFNPSRPYQHGDTVTVTLLPLSDTTGLAFADTLSWIFYIDLLPPQLITFSPSPETPFVSFPDTIRFVITEGITSVSYDSFSLAVGESLFTMDSPYIEVVGDTLFFTPPSSFFPSGREYRLSLSGIEDTPDYCPPNRMSDFNFSLFVGRFSFSLPDTSGKPSEGLRLPLVSRGGEASLDSIKVGIDYDPTVIVNVDLDLTGGWADGSELNILSRNEGSLSFRIRGNPHLTEGTMLWITLEINPLALGWDFSPLILGQVSLQGGYNAETRDGFIVVLPTSTAWLFDLNFNSTHGETGVISFGMASGGSSGFDPVVDRAYIPPPPNYISAFFPLRDPTYPYITALSRDVRGLSNNDEWLITSYGEGNLTWDRLALPEGQFLLNHIIDLRLHDSLTLGERESLIVTYDLPAPAISTIDFSYGWNLVSIPHSLARPDEPLRIFPYSMGYPYSYRANGSYFQAQSLEPGYGYWVLSLRDYECRIAGLKLEHKEVILEQGWNLIGGLDYPIAFTDSILSPSDAFIPNSLYRFSPEDCSYMLCDSILPTEGYFLAVAQPCTLKLGR